MADTTFTGLNGTTWTPATSVQPYGPDAEAPRFQAEETRTLPDYERSPHNPMTQIMQDIFPWRGDK